MHGMLDKGARDDDADVDAVGSGGRGVVVILGGVVRGPPGGRLGPLVEGLLGLGAGHKGLVGAVLLEEVRRRAVVLAAAAQRRLERLVPADAHVGVALLVEDHDVARVHAGLALGRDLRRAHDVELADLRVAREHLQALVVVADLEGLARHHPTAAERARLKPGHARLEACLGRGAALLVRELLLRRERHVQQHLRRQDKHVRRDAVAAHAMLALLDGLVEAHLLLLSDAIEHDLVLHGGLDVALGSEIFRPIVTEVVVGRREVGVEDVEVAGLLHAARHTGGAGVSVGTCVASQGAWLKGMGPTSSGLR